LAEAEAGALAVQPVVGVGGADVDRVACDMVGFLRRSDVLAGLFAAAVALDRLVQQLFLVLLAPPASGQVELDPGLLGCVGRVLDRLQELGIQVRDTGQ
jgi:hypothetical protein